MRGHWIWSHRARVFAVALLLLIGAPAAVLAAPKGGGGGGHGGGKKSTTTTTASTTTTTSPSCSLSPGSNVIDAWTATMPVGAVASGVYAHTRFFEVPAGCTYEQLTVRIEWGPGADLDLSVAAPDGTWTNAEDGQGSILADSSEELSVQHVPPGRWYSRTFRYASTGVSYSGRVTVVVR